MSRKVFCATLIVRGVRAQLQLSRPWGISRYIICGAGSRYFTRNRDIAAIAKCAMDKQATAKVSFSGRHWIKKIEVKA